MASKSQLLIAALQDAGYKPRGYSGRGMYGKECVAVSTDSPFAIGAAIVDIDVPEPQQDQLGKRFIFYWPSYPWVEPKITKRIDAKVEGTVNDLYCRSRRSRSQDRREAHRHHPTRLRDSRRHPTRIRYTARVGQRSTSRREHSETVSLESGPIERATRCHQRM